MSTTLPGTVSLMDRQGDCSARRFHVLTGQLRLQSWEAGGVGSTAYHPQMNREPHTAVPHRTDVELAAEVRRLFPEIRADLESLVRIPSVSFPGFDHSHVRRSAELTADLLAAAGMPDVEIIWHRSW